MYQNVVSLDMGTNMTTFRLKGMWGLEIGGANGVPFAGPLSFPVLVSFSIAFAAHSKYFVFKWVMCQEAWLIFGLQLLS